MKHFQLSEFLQSDTAEANCIDMTPTPNAKRSLERLVENVLDPLREAVGVPVRVSSGYRPQKLNALVGGSNTSQHSLGQAADISAEGYTPKELCLKIIACKLPFDQLIEEFGRWTHVSYGPRNRRQVLRAVRVKGRIVYLPGL